jgi:murein DD-endopeptidase MepM/ murein hydrolase activator NlpD
VGRLLLPLLIAPVLVAPASVSHAQNKPSQKTPAPPRNAATPKTTATPKGAHAPKPAACTHTVRSGESLSRIAARHRITRAALIGANSLAKPNALHAGQRLLVPGCRPAAQPGAGETRPGQAEPDGTVVKRVGPLRILTALVLNEPDFQGERIPLVWPIEAPVISTFGERARGWHAGIDISAEVGTEISAAAAGTVLYSGWIRAYGQVVKIQHSNGFVTLYAHNLKNMVEVGDEVEAGQVIATVGRSGHVTGPHVHFEVRRDGKAYNPLHLLEPSDKSPIFEDGVIASSEPYDHHE